MSPPGKKTADHEGVGRDRQADVIDPGEREHRLVTELIEDRIAEGCRPKSAVVSV